MVALAVQDPRPLYAAPMIATYTAIGHIVGSPHPYLVARWTLYHLPLNCFSPLTRQFPAAFADAHDLGKLRAGGPLRYFPALTNFGLLKYHRVASNPI